MSGTGDGICLKMSEVYMEIHRLYKKNPENFSEIGLMNHIARLESELAVVPRTAEKYMDVEKALMAGYETLHKMKYGTKKTIKSTVTKVDINELVDQADQAEQVLKDSKGEILATVKKEKVKA